MKRRLLIYFSYLGTNYRGLQRIISSNQVAQHGPDLESIQGVLEFGIKKILDREEPTISVSSRTDVGVHAIESTAQFDVYDSWFKKVPFSPERICQSLNLFLEKNECDIRLRRIIEVKPDFACRRALSRVYEFRIAVLNHEPHNITSPIRLSSAKDILDLYRCEVVHRPFHIQSVQEACKLFIGKHDFSTFMKSGGDVVEADKRIKTIRRFSLTPGVLMNNDYCNDEYSSSLNALPYDIYSFTVEGSGFLRRQVRRMVSVLVAVGRGIISGSDIVWMLENPKESNWNQKISTIGPNGLFLKEINYRGLSILRGYYS